MSLLDQNMFRLPAKAGARSPDCFGMLENRYFSPVTSAVIGNEFDSRAFAALHNNRDALGISDLWDCRNKGVLLDGVIKTKAKRYVLVEITQALSFATFNKSFVEILGGRQLCAIPASEALIVFERFNGDAAWKRGGWNKLIEISTAVRSQINIDVLLLGEGNQLCRYDQNVEKVVSI